MIVVAGAGPAGLTAALVAARAGHDVRVVEGAGEVGGMTRSVAVAGQRVDLGSHRLHPSMSPAAASLLLPLLGDDLQTRRRNGRVRIAGRWLGFPLRPVDLVARLPLPVGGRMALDAVTAPLRRPRAATFAEFVRAGLGPTVLDVFYGPYARKLWGRAPEHLSDELARRRIAVSTPGAMARRLVRGSGTSGATFLSPRQGFGRIAERLADAAVEAGAVIDLGCPLRSVRSTPDSIEIDCGSASHTAASLLSTVPLAVLLRALGEEPPPLEHRGLVIAHLVTEGPCWTEFDAHYLPGADVVASRISEPKNYRTSSDDPAGVSVLCAEIPTSAGDAWWDASAGEVAGRFVDDLGRLGLPRPRITETVLHRIDRVYPVYGPGEDPLGRAEALLDRHPNVVSFGRGGRFNADNTHHAVDMGIAAAGSLDAAGRIDRRHWEIARSGFADHVVAD